MNKRILIVSVVAGCSGILNFEATAAAGASGGGGGGGGGAAAVHVAAPAARSTPASPNSSTIQNGQNSQAGQMQPNTTTSSQSEPTAGTGQDGVNHSTSGGAGNSAPIVNGQAATASDRILLNTLNQSVASQLGVNSAVAAREGITSGTTVQQNSTTQNNSASPNTISPISTMGQTTATGQNGFASPTALTGGNSTAANTGTQNTMPVHFLVNNGAVTLVGTVPTADQSQRIQARVAQTPGVLSVFNDLRVGNAAQTTASQTPSYVGAVTDHAFSPADRSLLTAVQQTAGAQLGINGASTQQMPVHFSIENGVVGVTGEVSSQQEKQALLAAVQRTSGVTRVVDNVGVANPAAGGVTSPMGDQAPSFNNNNLTPTSRGGASNAVFLNPTTNRSGF